MKQRKTVGALLVVLSVLGGGPNPACWAVPAAPSSPEGKTYYTRANMWFERDNVMESTNYHSGDMLPVATRVRIESMGSDRIVFVVGEKDSYTLAMARRHVRRDMTLEELFQQYFDTHDPMAPESPFHRFSKAEQRNIAEGTLAVGMRREAVLMAYGYPPSHKTPDLNATQWIYWKKGRSSFTLSFGEDGRVTELNGY